MKEIRISLDHKDFGCLLCGGELSITDQDKEVTAKIILKDIGFDHMRSLVKDASTYPELHYKPRERTND